jgi:hypothetical protein
MDMCWSHDMDKWWGKQHHCDVNQGWEIQNCDVNQRWGIQIVMWIEGGNP